MEWLLKQVMKSLGASYLLEKAWEATLPYLKEWAADDGQEDWDDAFVDVMDKSMKAIIAALKKG